MLKSIIIAVVIAGLGFIPLMGLPGAVVLGMAQPTTKLFYGPLAHEFWMSKLGDRAWPMAIFLNFVWPVAIPVFYYLVTKLFPSQAFFSFKPFSVFLLGMLLWVVVVGQTAISMSGTIKSLAYEELIETAVTGGKAGVFKKHYVAGKGEFKVDLLRQAIFNRQSTMVHLLVKGRNDLDRYIPVKDQESIQFASPLHTAVNVGSVEIVRLLLDAGANPNVVNVNGHSPLFALSWDPKGNGEILRMLNEKGADFTMKDLEGNTPLIALAANVLNSWPQIVDYAKIMIAAGVDPHATNSEGKTVLYYAEENYHRELVEYIQSL